MLLLLPLHDSRGERHVECFALHMHDIESSESKLFFPQRLTIGILCVCNPVVRLWKGLLQECSTQVNGCTAPSWFDPMHLYRQSLKCANKP